MTIQEAALREIRRLIESDRNAPALAIICADIAAVALGDADPVSSDKAWMENAIYGDPTVQDNALPNGYPTKFCNVPTPCGHPQPPFGLIGDGCQLATTRICAECGKLLWWVEQDGGGHLWEFFR